MYLERTMHVARTVSRSETDHVAAVYRAEYTYRITVKAKFRKQNYITNSAKKLNVFRTDDLLTGGIVPGSESTWCIHRPVRSTDTGSTLSTYEYLSRCIRS
jgi:hypothetical protein